MNGSAFVVAAANAAVAVDSAAVALVASCLKYNYF